MTVQRRKLSRIIPSAHSQLYLRHVSDTNERDQISEIYSICTKAARSLVKRRQKSDFLVLRLGRWILRSRLHRRRLYSNVSLLAG